MGKLKKSKGKKTNASKLQTSNIESASLLSTQISKDLDVTSVRSMKSFKNKFGIKRQIKKSDKIKIKKEILKQKIDFIKDVTPKKPLLMKDFKNVSLQVEKPSNNIHKEFICDENEEYMKLKKQKKGVEKQKKRKKRTIEDINSLKQLMFGMRSKSAS